jgi:hypothetical protein
MDNKKYVGWFLTLVGIVFWANVVMWYGFSKDYFMHDEDHGDLSRAAIMSHVKAKTPNIKYKKIHIELPDYLRMQEKPSVDILTFGDSFSNGAGGTYYQDYLTDAYNMSVLNVPKIGASNPVAVLRNFIETGIIEEINPKIVILGSAEKYVVERLDGHDKMAKVIPREELIKQYSEYSDGNKKDIDGLLPGIMAKYNLQVLEATIKGTNKGNKLSNNVYKEDLKENLFTNEKRENMLLFSDEDLWGQKSEINFEELDKNLTDIAIALKERDIQLVVMFNVDKMDLYQPYIVTQNKYRENKLMDEFTQHAQGYVFINTRDILRKMLREGEKDVYWQDDTHWSWKAQQRVVDVLMTEVRFRDL